MAETNDTNAGIEQTLDTQTQEGTDGAAEGTGQLDLTFDTANLHVEQPEIEAQARALGWVPQDVYKGSAKWVDAKKFLERGQQHVGMLRENLNKVAQEKEDLKRQLNDLQTTVAEFTKFQNSIEERAHERAVKTIDAQIAEAVQNSDGERVVALMNEKAALKAPVKKDPPAAAAPANEDPAFVAWKQSNEWYEKDADLQEYADFVAVRLRKKGDKTTGAQFGDTVKAEVAKRFPEKFRARQAPAGGVDSGGSGGSGGNGGGGGAGSGAKSYASLPADAKAACDKYCRTIKGYTKEQYLKDYYGS